MKKKLLTLAMAAVMVVSSAVTAFAADAVTLDGSAGWWKAWTPSYEVKDGETLEFDIDVKGGDTVWNNVCAAFATGSITGQADPNEEKKDDTTYKELAVIRGDNYGWGGDYATVAWEGGMGTETGLAEADFIAMMKDAHLDVTISRSGNEVTYTYVAAGGDKTMTRTAKFTASESSVHVFFIPDTSTVTVTPVVKETTTQAPTETTTVAAGGNNNNNNSTGSTGSGDTAPVLALLAVAAVAGAVVVLRKKEVTE